MPAIIFTTSRRPNPRLRSFVKDMVSVIPNAIRLTRGHLSMAELAREAVIHGADRVAIVADRRGNPGIIRVYDVDRDGLSLRNIVSMIVKGVTLSREARSVRLPPGVVKELYVVHDGSDLAMEFAEAFIIAFHAKLGRAKGPGSVEAIISQASSGIVEVLFKMRGKVVGPRLRLAKPQEMIKIGGGGG